MKFIKTISILAFFMGSHAHSEESPLKIATQKACANLVVQTVQAKAEVDEMETRTTDLALAHAKHAEQIGDFETAKELYRLAKWKKEPVFGNEKVEKFILSETKRYMAQKKFAKLTKAEKERESLNYAQNVLKATLKADRSFYPTCYRHFAKALKPCMGLPEGQRNTCLVPQTQVARNTYRRMTNQIFAAK